MRPDRIFQLEKADESAVSYSASIPLFLEWRDHNQVFQNIGAYLILPVRFNLAGKDRPERIACLRVNADLFRVLGIEPRLGSNLTAQDDREGAQRVVLLSESLWRRRYNNDPTIVGKQITIDGEPATIVGVLPAGFQFLAIAPTSTAIELWTPLRLPTASRDPSGVLECIARLKDGVTPAQAVSQMTTLSRGFALQLPPAFPGQGRVELLSVSQRISEDVRPTLLLLLGGTAFVLVIACANVANLLSVRMADRTRELALRADLGASRFRIIRQLLTESLLVGALGSISGLAVALASLRILAGFAPVSISQFQNPDPRLARPTLFCRAFDSHRSPLRTSSRAPGIAIACRQRAARCFLKSDDFERSPAQALRSTYRRTNRAVLGAAGRDGPAHRELRQTTEYRSRLRLCRTYHLETTLPPANFAEPLTLSRFLNRASQNIAGLPQVNSVTAMSTLPTEPTSNAPFYTRRRPSTPVGSVDRRG